MAGQIYDKTDLRKRVVAHLREHGRHQTTGQVALAVGVEYWAADSALEEAYLAKEVTFSAGIGWLGMAVATAQPAAAADEQTELKG